MTPFEPEAAQGRVRASWRVLWDDAAPRGRPARVAKVAPVLAVPRGVGRGAPTDRQGLRLAGAARQGRQGRNRRAFSFTLGQGGRSSLLPIARPRLRTRR